jgi:cyanophycinase
MQLTEAKGKLVVVGGAEDTEGDCLILKEFLKLAKGARARVVVMTVATDKPQDVGDEYVSAFKRLGVDDVKQVDVSTREDATDGDAIKLIEKATGLYFTGGDQLHITSLLGGTEMQRVMYERYERGLVIAGTSAGAAMMGNSMILGGGGDESPRMEGVEIGPGMDLVIGAIIDTHFSERGRHGRLLTAVAHYPQDLGLGIDEDTAMIVENNEFTVIGKGAVTIIDGGAMTYSNLPYVEKDDSLALYDVRVHVIPDGHKFSLPNRQPIVEKAQTKKNGGSNGGKSNGPGKTNGSGKAKAAARGRKG